MPEPGRERQHRGGEKPRAVLGAHGGIVAPDFAPAGVSLRILEAQKDARPVVHRAEGRAHRLLHRHAMDKDLGFVKGHGFLGLAPAGSLRRRPGGNQPTSFRNRLGSKYSEAFVGLDMPPIWT